MNDTEWVNIDEKKPPPDELVGLLCDEGEGIFDWNLGYYNEDGSVLIIHGSLAFGLYPTLNVIEWKSLKKENKLEHELTSTDK